MTGYRPRLWARIEGTGVDDEPVSVAVIAVQLCMPVPGGTGRYTEELVTALSRLPAAAGRIRAVAVRGCAAARRLPVPVDVVRLPVVALARLWERGLPPAVARSGVVHAPTLLVPPRRTGVRLVVTIHDVVPWTHPETLTSRGVRFHDRMGRRAAAEADVIVTPTHAVADAVGRILEPACRVEVVAPGRSSLRLPADATARVARLGAPERYVLFVGTAEPRKGLDVAVAAMAQPALRGHGLVVAGPQGWGDVRVADLARAAGVADRVVVTGRVSEEDLAALYACARAVVVPSRAEGFGLPVLEAMQSGVPVVTTDDPALVEVGGGAALVVPVDDAEALAAAAAEAAAEGQGRLRRVAAGRRRAEDFSWDAAAARMWSLYGAA